MDTLLEDTRACHCPRLSHPVFWVNPHHGPSYSSQPQPVACLSPVHPLPSTRRRRGRGGGTIPGSLDGPNQRHIYPMGTRHLGSESLSWACSPGAGHGARQYPPPPILPASLEATNCPRIAHSPPTLSQAPAPGTQFIPDLLVARDGQPAPYALYLRPQTSVFPAKFAPLLNAYFWMGVVKGFETLAPQAQYPDNSLRRFPSR